MSFLPRDLIIQTRPGMRQTVAQGWKPTCQQRQAAASHDTVRQQNRLPGFVERLVCRMRESWRVEMVQFRRQRRNGLSLTNVLSPVGSPAVHSRQCLGPPATQSSNRVIMILATNRSLMDHLDSRLPCLPADVFFLFLQQVCTIIIHG